MISIAPDLLPSAENVRFYEEHGWYISKPILSGQLIEEAVVGSQRYYAGIRDRELPGIHASFNWTPEHGAKLRLNSYVSLQVDEFKNLVRQKIIGAIAARLAGTSAIRLFRDQLILKPPAAQADPSRIGWHADKAYWQTCTSDRMLTAWVPFEDCGERDGTLIMLDGSHRWDEDGHLRNFDHQDLETFKARMHGIKGYRVEEVPMVLRKGQVSFHHCKTVHGSRDNLSGRPRMALAIHLQDAENRYQAALNSDGLPVAHLNDFLCRRLPGGDPDYADPHICPVICKSETPDR